MGEFLHMSTQQKKLTIGALLGLVLALVAGVALASTYLALGTFLWGAAVMLGPFVGVGLFVFASRAVATAPQRTLSCLGGVLLLASVGLVLFSPVGSSPGASFPLYVAGGLSGAAAIALVKPRALARA